MVVVAVIVVDLIDSVLWIGMAVVVVAITGRM